ncbi:MAG TPA: dihydroxy-acid dehydratase, partial [Draconibacterium sp.]|nr:dihydroxy-acid dehydratase [Draconibacterium sp.]
GPIGAIQDGDIIDINIADRSLNVRLTDNQIKQRLSSVTIPERTLTNLLKTYRRSYTGFNCYGKKA